MPIGLVRADACENRREGGPGRTPYGSAGESFGAVIACERAPGADEPPAAGQVLTHPTFDRPPVPNERRPGRKAGAVSLAAARRRKAAEAPLIEPEGHASDRGRIAPPFRGPGAESPGAAADLIELEVLFEGTLTQTSVYPRDVARRALHWNAGAVILAHNHPSGQAEPSRADQHLTQALRAELALVDTRVLDHLVIGWPEVVSMAERGLMRP